MINLNDHRLISFDSNTTNCSLIIDLQEVMQKPDWKQSFDGQKFVNHFMGAYFSDRSDSSTQTVLVQPRERPVRIFREL